MYKLIFAFLSLFFLVAPPASAAGSPQSNWVVTQLSGDARVVHPGAQAASLKVNNQLAPGDTLVTGLSGRATLVRGSDYIIVAPRSELRLPSTPQPTGFTRVIQNLGTLLFKVQHTGIPHFAVDTPMLAAVVKGTTFTVVVDQHRSAVQVIQGVVQVTAIDGGMRQMVEGGRTVFINHDRPNMLLDAGKAAPATAPSSTSVTVSATGDSPLATIATLTGGLVRADLTAPQSAPADATNAVAVQTVQTVVATASPTPSNSRTPTSPPSPATTPLSTPVATTPVATVVATTTPIVTAPGAGTPNVTVGSVASPTVSTPSVTVAPITTPVVSVSSVAAPSVTVTTAAAPTVTVPSASTPAVTAGPVTVPGVTIPSVSVGSNSGPGSMNSGPGSMNSGSGSTPTVSVQPVATPAVTVPSVSTPTVPVPALTTPTITTPLPPIPSVSTPTVTVPSVTTPTVPVPPVAPPVISLPGLLTIKL